MTSALSKRLDRLEALLAARTATPIWHWQMDAEGDPEVELQRLIDSGEIDARDKHRVTIFRWLTREESIERGELLPDPPPYVQPQLPGPPERKLLAAPSGELKSVAADGSGVASANEEPDEDDPYERRLAVPPRKKGDKFHGPVEYPRTGDGI